MAIKNILLAKLFFLATLYKISEWQGKPWLNNFV